jgi:hypothetical protein
VLWQAAHWSSPAGTCALLALDECEVDACDTEGNTALMGVCEYENFNVADSAAAASRFTPAPTRARHRLPVPRCFRSRSNSTKPVVALLLKRHLADESEGTGGCGCGSGWRRR